MAIPGAREGSRALGEGRGQAQPWVYPRMCGGTEKVEARCRSLLGLSPRVRGNHLSDGAAETVCGSIPACAGEPFCIAALKGLSRVYPRVCGGTTSATDTAVANEGLSPRVRGNRK